MEHQFQASLTFHTFHRPSPPNLSPPAPCSIPTTYSSRQSLLNHRRHLPEHQAGCPPPQAFSALFVPPDSILISSIATEHQKQPCFTPAHISCGSHKTFPPELTPLICCFVTDPSSNRYTLLTSLFWRHKVGWGRIHTFPTTPEIQFSPVLL